MACGKHHEPKDALSINFIVVFLNTNVTRVRVSDLHELRCRACVDSELICDGEVFLRHGEKYCVAATVKADEMSEKTFF